MSNLVIRLATLGDIEQLEALEGEVWAEGSRASAKQWESRINIFPEGTIVAATRDGTIFGAVSSLLTDYDLDCPVATWDEVTAGGYITNHNPRGRFLYGVDFSVRPGAPAGASDGLLLAGARLGIRKNVEAIILGSRIPRYHRHADVISAEDYVYLSRNGTRSIRVGDRRVMEDPELYIYRTTGMEVGTLLPEYFEDPDSCNYGVLMIWRNELVDYPLPRLLSRLAAFKVVRRLAKINI